MKSLDTVKQITAEAAAVLDAESWCVTYRPDAAAAALTSGQHAVLVMLDTIEIEGNIWHYTLDMLAVSPVADPIDAWPALDAAANRLCDLEPHEIGLTSYQPVPPRSPIYPAAKITLIRSYTR